MKKLLMTLVLLPLMAFMALLGRAESWVDENQNVWGYSVSGGSATIIGTLQQSGVLRVPSAVSGIPVVSIAGNAFEGHRWLSGAVIPEGVTNVGYVAFDSCANLRSVSLPNSLISIEGWAFGYCSELESVTIPVGVVRIGEDAFFACSSLAEVTIPSSVENIGGDAFWGCDSLRTVYVDPGDVTRVKGMLRGSGLSLSNISFVEIPYSGGTFANTGEFERAEAEVGTKTVVVDIVRNSTGNMRQSMTIDSPGRSSTSFVDIIWLEGETKKAVLLQDFDTRYFTLGRNVILKLLDQNGLARSILSIPCVVRENSSVNPDFSGCPDFGVWTMDLEAAMRKVRKTIEMTGSNAYTLVSVQGSQWCPDCEDVERNFLGLQDDSGRNRFAMWAKSRNIALAVVDIPNFRGPLSSDVNSPSLLSRAAYKTFLSDSGLRSGLGYLTRKNVSDADAEKMLARNYDLVTRLTSQGGFRRPEDRNPTRTGVPIFVLLRKDGSVAARLTQWSVMGPTATDRANFDNYIKRFEEMLWIADHDASEIENNSAFGTVDELSANGGWWTATLCNADSVDVFRLTAWSGGVRQSIAVTGTSSARVRVSLIAREGEFEEELVSSTGCLSDGITVEHELVSGADNFVKIEADDLSTEGFKLGSPIDANFQQYEISCDCVIIPREEQSVARPARGSDKLTVYLEEGTVYLMEGLVGCAALAPCGCAIGMYRATVTGNVTVTLRDVDGRLTHQIWRSGAVGFRESTLVVGEGSCWAPIEVVLKREGGKSGRISVRVDAVEVAHAAGRYRFDPTIVTWEDGDSDDKSVSLTIFDDVRYDGKGLIELRLSEVESNIGDATIAEDGGTCLITVYDDDCPSPGTEVDVFWDPQDGTSLLLHQKGVCGKVIGTLPTPTRSKYKFNGWYTSVVGGTKVSSTTKVTGDVTYYAHWTYDGSATVAVDVGRGCAEMGSVSGGKTAKGGTKVTLKATANKGYVFAGWYRDAEGEEPVEGETDYRSPSYAYVVGEDDATFYAKFIPIEDDRIEVETSVCSEFVPGVPIGREAIVVYVTSESLPTVKVTGLPTGLKFDAKTLAISGMPTKSGVYIATVTATSAGKKTATDTMKIVVRAENESLVDAEWDASKGKVTGIGVCAAGKTLTLKATANKGYVFAGWYCDADWCSDEEGGWRPCDFYDPIDWGVDYRNPTLTVPGGGEDVQLYARFIPEHEDDVDVSAWVAGEYTRGMGIEPIEIDVDSESLPTIKVTGLPTGLKFTNKRIVSKWGLIEAEANTIYGTPTKSGVYTVTVSATTAGKWTSTKQFRIIVRGANEYAVSAKGVYRCPLNACCCDYTPSLDAVSGNGVYTFGKKVTLKAPSAPKGQVFAGWYVTDDCRYADDENWWGDPPEEFFGTCSPVVGDADHRNPSLTVTAGRVDRPGELHEGDFECYALYMYSEFDTELRANVEDAYYLNGPWSLKLDVESMSLPTVTVKGLPSGLKFDAKTLTISGTPTKPGTYPVTLTLKNKTITKARTQGFTLYVANIESPYLKGINYANDAYVYRVGTSMEVDIGSCATDGYSVTGVSGLPSGLKFDKNTGLVSGVPTKAGPKTVTITLKNGKLTSSATITLNVDAIDTWAYGTFNGGGEDGVLTLTVGNTGKISGKWMTVDGTWTLSAKSYESYDEDEQGCYRCLVAAKCGTKTAHFWLDACDGRLNLYEYLPSLCGYGSLVATAKRNVWKDDQRKDLAIQMMGASFALTDEVSLKVGSFGAVTATGKFVTGRNANGKDIVYSASCSTVLVPVEADVFKLYLCFPKKDGKFDGMTLQEVLEWSGSELSIGCAGCREGF